MNIDKFFLPGYDGVSLGSWILFCRGKVMSSTSKAETSKILYFGVSFWPMKWGTYVSRKVFVLLPSDAFS